MAFVPNPRVESTLSDAASPRQPLAFHRRLSGYAPTPLRLLPGLAARLGLAALRVKDESQRLGLPAFKILGASWALARLLDWVDGAAGEDPIESMRHAAVRRGLRRLVTATDGNHGRAVARLARLLELEARIFLPAGTVPDRVEALEGEGAEVVPVNGSYDDAVELAAREGGGSTLVLQDTAFPGYEEIPGWIVEGYATLFHEIDAQLAENATDPPDTAIVPVGVGSLVSAAVRHLRRPEACGISRLLGVEPEGSDCAARALERGQRIDVPGPHRSMMAGLNAGRLSVGAWPWIRRGLDGVVVVRDEQAAEAMRLLAAEGIRAGESGAASLAAVLELHAIQPELLDGASLLLLSTEGVTDRANYARVVEGC